MYFFDFRYGELRNSGNRFKPFDAYFVNNFDNDCLSSLNKELSLGIYIKDSERSYVTLFSAVRV